MSTIKHIAVVIAFNDLEYFHGGTRNGIKSTLSYFEQFLILYESIRTNWKEHYFTYDFYVFHSIPFTEKKMDVLNQLDIHLEMINYPLHKYKIRPICYTSTIKCDYRLVLDVDMLAVKEPPLNLDKDFYAMYGGNKYGYLQWLNICKFLKIKMPKQYVSFFRKGNYFSWGPKEYELVHTKNLKKRLFPYFNNGAVLIKNDISKKFGHKWEENRLKYTEYIKNKYNTDIDQEGQDMVGITISSITDNWAPLPTGVNFIIQENKEEGRRIMETYKGEVYLLHYIGLISNNEYKEEVSKFYNIVRSKYNF